MTTTLIRQVLAKAEAGHPPTFEEAVELFNLPPENALDLIAAAHAVRLRHKGKTVELCAIVNAKSGRCAEDCAFCAQSAHYRTGVATYPLISAEEMVMRARQAAASGAHAFGIVTSGVRIKSRSEWEEILRAVRTIAEEGQIRPDASLGLINEEQAAELKAAGLFMYHHNLETAPSFFSQICTTHDLAEDIATVKAAKKAGLKVCCGGILGLGETPAQRVELAFLLRELAVDSVPLNFLNPIPGTPLEHRPLMNPWEALKSVAVFRLILPDKDIRLCGGKEVTLRQLLPLGLLAGANGLMTGNYLTTSGRDPGLDYELIKDLELIPAAV
jgi:biotin synthase